MCPSNAWKKQGFGLILLPRKFFSKEGIVFPVKAVSDSIDLSAPLGFQWAILTPEGMYSPLS